MWRRRLPAEQVIWLVIGMGLFRDRSISEVVSKLDLALPDPKSVTVARSPVPPARDRVGEEPVAWLFDECASKWAHASADNHRWRGLALYGVDGTTIRTADSDENRAFFGSVHKNNQDTQGYPLLRLVALMALRTHLLAKAAFGPSRHGEYRCRQSRAGFRSR